MEFTLPRRDQEYLYRSEIVRVQVIYWRSCSSYHHIFISGAHTGIHYSTFQTISIFVNKYCGQPDLTLPCTTLYWRMILLHDRHLISPRQVYCFPDQHIHPWPVSTVSDVTNCWTLRQSAVTASDLLQRPSPRVCRPSTSHLLLIRNIYCSSGNTENLHIICPQQWDFLQNIYVHLEII